MPPSALRRSQRPGRAAGGAHRDTLGCLVRSARLQQSTLARRHAACPTIKYRNPLSVRDMVPTRMVQGWKPPAVGDRHVLGSPGCERGPRSVPDPLEAALSREDPREVSASLRNPGESASRDPGAGHELPRPEVRRGDPARSVRGRLLRRPWRQLHELVARDRRLTSRMTVSAADESVRETERGRYVHPRLWQWLGWTSSHVKFHEVVTWD
jgi:hypothetical protein